MSTRPVLDTIKFLSPVSLSESEMVSVIPDATEHTSLSTGEVYYTGMLRGLRCKIHPSHAIVEGSIAKFAQEDVRAIKELCELLHGEPDDSQVWRVDVGTSLLLSEPAWNTIALLGERPRFFRSLRTHGVTYIQAQHQHKGYDKVREILRELNRGKIDPSALPEEWRAMNALRMETSMFRNIKGQLELRTGDGRCLSLADLCDVEIYTRIVQLWEADYFAIQKRGIVTMNGKPAFSGVRGMEQYLAWKSLLAPGEEAKVLAAICATPDKKVRQRLRAKIRALNSLPAYTEESPLIEELNKKVREAAEEALSS